MTFKNIKMAYANQARCFLLILNFVIWMIGVSLFLLGLLSKIGDHNFSSLWNKLNTHLSADLINAFWILLMICGFFTAILGIFVRYCYLKVNTKLNNFEFRNHWLFWC